MLSKDAAEIRAVQALTWLLGQDDLVPVFMGATGASADDMRDLVQDPAFLIGVVDFILMDDQWVMAWAADTQSNPQDLQIIRASLPGGDHPNWT
jgi:hypothetical protein